MGGVAMVSKSPHAAHTRERSTQDHPTALLPHQAGDRRGGADPQGALDFFDCGGVWKCAGFCGHGGGDVGHGMVPRRVVERLIILSQGAKEVCRGVKGAPQGDYFCQMILDQGLASREDSESEGAVVSGGARTRPTGSPRNPPPPQQGRPWVRGGGSRGAVTPAGTTSAPGSSVQKLPSSVCASTLLPLGSEAWTVFECRRPSASRPRGRSGGSCPFTTRSRSTCRSSTARYI